MISINNLSHEFEIGKKGRKTIIPVLKDVSFKVNRGEIVTIVEIGRASCRERV